jgi:hypothetical protein
MASLLIRTFWPTGGQPPPAEVAAIVVVYSWLGLAMSGPFLLLVGRPSGPAGPGPVGGATRTPEDSAAINGSRTWAELAWLIIGFYWLGLMVLVVPVRLRRSPLQDATLLGVLPIAAALVLRFLDRRSRPMRAGRDAPSWTHRAAVGLLITWPIAWVALILVGKSLF